MGVDQLPGTCAATETAGHGHSHRPFFFFFFFLVAQSLSFPSIRYYYSSMHIYDLIWWLYLSTNYLSIFVYVSIYLSSGCTVCMAHLFVCLFSPFYIIKSIYTSISIPCIYQGNFMANGVYGRKMIILWIQQIPGCISRKGMCQMKIRVGQKIFISKDSAKRKLESVYLKISY